MSTNSNNFKEILKFISTGIGVRPVGSYGLWLTKEYIEKKFTDWGYTPILQNFNHEAHEISNVIASLMPTGEVKNVIVFVAHYDSVPVGRGSMDNASGVAVVMELARTFSENYATLHRDDGTSCNQDVSLTNQVNSTSNSLNSTIYNHNMIDDIEEMLKFTEAFKSNNTELRFIALTGEEVGCVGSIAYVDSLTETEKRKIKAVYNFDMFMSRHGDPATLVVNTVGGYNSNGEYIDGTDEIPFDNIISRNVEKAIIELRISDKDITGENYWSPRNYGHSDHETFHKSKIESANVTIRGKKSVNGKLPEGYHTKNDTYNEKTFDFPQAEKYLHAVYHSILNVLIELSK